MIKTKRQLQYQRIKTKKEYLDFYQDDDSAREYARRDFLGANPLITQVETEAIVSFSSSYFSPSRAKVLDLATGSGRIVVALEKHFSKIIGIDTSKVLLDVARKRTSVAKFKLADFEKLPFGRSFFDLVTGFRFMINLPRKNRLEVFKEARRVLKKNGILAVNIHLNKLSPRGIRDVIFGARSAGKVVSFFGLKRELEAAKLKVIGLQGSNMVIFYRLLPFLPSSFLVSFDKFIGRLPVVKYFCDTLIVFSQKSD